MREGWWAWCALAASVAAPERAAAEPCLLTPCGWWLRAQVSRDAPPPLPGGYKVGEKVFYTGASKTWDDGDKRMHGQQGEVVGPATYEDGEEGLLVLFPGNKDRINCLLTEVRRLHAASAATPRLHRPHATLPTLRAPSILPRQTLPRCPNPSRKRSRARHSSTPSAGVRGGCVMRASGF
eukprot:scaffold76866_cov56-Phaeocystis_antarctica.AAC.6